MASPMKFGVILIQNAEWQTILQRCQHIERLGFDSVWVADHFVNYRDLTQPWFEAWTLLTGLATQTTRIRIGTLVTAIPLRNPAVLARQALTLDHISNGRLELGLGTGAAGDIGYKMAGIEDWTAAERVARFREAIFIIDSMLSNEVTSYEGKYYRVDGAVMRPPSVQQPRPPITIAALGPAMLKITAQYADKWNSYPGVGLTGEEAVNVTRARSEMLDEYCAQIGRDPASIRRSYLSYGRVSGPSPFDSVDYFEEYVGRYREIGIEELIFYYPPTEWYPLGNKAQDETFERIATEVIPRLRNA